VRKKKEREKKVARRFKLRLKAALHTKNFLGKAK
jgi:hypothetical protein